MIFLPAVIITIQWVGMLRVKTEIAKATQDMKEYAPGLRLRPFIKSYMIVESATGMENSIIPDTSLVVGFRLRGTVSDKVQPGDPHVPRLAFSGLRNHPRIFNYAQNSATLLVNFAEGGAAAFFKTPLHILFGQIISLDNFIPWSELAEVSEKIDEAGSDMQRMRLVEQFFLKRIDESKFDRLIAHSVQLINHESGNIRISQLIKDLCISKDSFEKRFRKSIGASPKQFANIVRLKNCVDNYDSDKSLTEIALDTGYYDQSHFIHDFKLFTGQTPYQFFHKRQF